MFKRLFPLFLVLAAFVPVGAQARDSYYVGTITIKIAGKAVDTNLFVRIDNDWGVSGSIFLYKTKTTGTYVPFLGTLNKVGRYRAKVLPTPTKVTGQLAGAISKDKKTFGGSGFLKMPDGKKAPFKVHGKLVYRENANGDGNDVLASIN